MKTYAAWLMGLIFSTGALASVAPHITCQTPALKGKPTYFIHLYQGNSLSVMLEKHDVTEGIPVVEIKNFSCDEGYFAHSCWSEEYQQSLTLLVDVSKPELSVLTGGLIFDPRKGLSCKTLN